MSIELLVQILGGLTGLGIAYIMYYFVNQRDLIIEEEIKEKNKLELELFRKQKLRELSNK